MFNFDTYLLACFEWVPRSFPMVSMLYCTALPKLYSQYIVVPSSYANVRLERKQRQSNEVNKEFAVHKYWNREASSITESLCDSEMRNVSR